MSQAPATADWSTLELATGQRVLIEASAGTGKTWTIAALYLRLLLEQDLGVTQIAVTTFTDAAAQELRERLRRRLREAEALASGAREPVTDDTVDAWLDERWQQEERRQRERLRLRLALAELDLAPIGTLHALCRKVLAEQPFAAGSGFRFGELVSERSVRAELLADLRRYLSHADADAQREAALQSLAESNDADLGQLIGFVLDADSELRLVDADWRAQLLACFTLQRAEAMEALAARPVWASRKTKLKNQLLNMATLVRDGDPWVELDGKPTVLHVPDPSDQVRPELLAEVESDPGLQALVETVDCLRLRKTALRSEALREVRPLLRQWRRQRLADREQFTFDDLIDRVREAVRGSDESAASLASILHEAWPAALIDEFQDTDSRQYAIFDRIYRDAAGAPRGLLVMIGDPKQAIYAFRGGDIHTYLRAAGQATQTLSLATNFRSSRSYVSAMNGFYALAGDGFGAAGIEYHEVAASSRCEGKPLLRDAVEVRQSLRIEIAHADDFPALAAERQALALNRCADAIADWLQPGRAHIGSKPLQPGQIAVLLPNNRQIVELRGLLQARNVPCVGAGRSTVFASPWAESLRLVLHALLDPGDAPALRAALSSALLAFDFAALAALREDQEAWSQQVERFHRLARHWRERGPLAVVVELLQQTGPRLLAGSDGERALTDLRQLGELLQQQTERVVGPEQLLAWFAGQCEDGSDDDASEEA
ncbi:MAG TPA: UvrD-helicase domain-containing protein, partial [Arenimonas sp.]|nr:UvrD-helicase domain-containing protein [Arenimonas sp.]